MWLYRYQVPFYAVLATAVATIAVAAPVLPVATDAPNLRGMVLTALVALLPLLCLLALRCARAVTRRNLLNTRYSPPWFPALVVPLLVLAVLSRSGDVIPLALLVAAGLSQLAFVAAGAAVDAADRGEEPSPGAVNLLFHLGGVSGVVYARRVFAGSPALERLPTGIRGAAVVVFCAVVALWAFQSSPIPDSPAPFETKGFNPAPATPGPGTQICDPITGKPLYDPTTGAPVLYPARPQFERYSATKQQLEDARKEAKPPRSFEETQREVDRLIGRPK